METSVLRNQTFDELKVGDSASRVRIVGRDDIDLFAAVSGDVNPAHLDAAFAATDLFGHVVAHAMRLALSPNLPQGNTRGSSSQIGSKMKLHRASAVAPAGSNLGYAVNGRSANDLRHKPRSLVPCPASS